MGRKHKSKFRGAQDPKSKPGSVAVVKKVCQATGSISFASVCDDAFAEEEKVNFEIVVGGIYKDAAGNRVEIIRVSKLDRKAAGVFIGDDGKEIEREYNLNGKANREAGVGSFQHMLNTMYFSTDHAHITGPWLENGLDVNLYHPLPPRDYARDPWQEWKDKYSLDEP